jgi:hypothetical protein
MKRNDWENSCSFEPNRVRRARQNPNPERRRVNSKPRQKRISPNAPWKEDFFNV